MSLTTDAECTDIAKLLIAETAINKCILKKIEDDLDVHEKVSILFLMVKDYTTAFDEVFGLFKTLNTNYVLPNFVDKHHKSWEGALLEALCLVQNRQIIRKLGICYSKLEPLYLPNVRLCSKNFHAVVKCLYALCESLTEDQTKQIIQAVVIDLPEYDPDLQTVNILELHLLYWLKRGYISICKGGTVTLKNLLKHIKQFDNLELISIDLELCESQRIKTQNVLDTHNVSSSNAHKVNNFSSEKRNVLPSPKTQIVRKIEKGLCIIINEVFFVGGKYETRFGSKADCDKLEETFKGFNFEVYCVKNLTKTDLLEQLKNIPQKFGTTYDCIFICILSHGSIGSIITSDEEEVSIKVIENVICCPELMDVIKIVVVQACQGKVTGQIRTLVTTDGPHKSESANIQSYRNFCIFMSTIQGFVSVRHKIEGSWFIQELCNILQSAGSEMTFYAIVSKVIQSVEKKRGTLDDTDDIAQLPELRNCRLVSDFQFPVYCPKKQ